MKQLLINVFCFPVSKSYDFWIPSKMKVKTAIALLCDDISHFENNAGLFSKGSGMMLCSYMEGKALPPSQTFEQAGVKSGDRLALM